MRTFTCFFSVAAILVIFGADYGVSAAPYPCILMKFIPTDATVPTPVTTSAPTSAATPSQAQVVDFFKNFLGKNIIWEPHSESENNHSEVENIHSEIETFNTEPVVSPKSNPPEIKNPFEELVTNYMKFMWYVLSF